MFGGVGVGVAWTTGVSPAWLGVASSARTTALLAMDGRRFKIQAQGFSLEQVKLNFRSLSVKEDALDASLTLYLGQTTFLRLFSRSISQRRL